MQEFQGNKTYKQKAMSKTLTQLCFQIIHPFYISYFPNLSCYAEMSPMGQRGLDDNTNYVTIIFYGQWTG